MPHSYNFFNNEIETYIFNNFNININILDVGPGSGKYGKMLNTYNIDALEIYAPYIKQFKLNNIYKNIIIEDIRNFNNFSKYSLVIMGDILEHLSVEDATTVLNNIIKVCHVIVAVPYTYKNDHHHHDNKHEIHLQDDLTPEIMKQRYPMLIQLIKNDQYGIYIDTKITSDVI